MPSSFPDVLSDLSSRAQFTLVGDGNHEKVEIHEAMASEETFAAMERSGVRHLFIEIPTALQPLGEQLVQGQIDRAEFIHQFSEKMFLTNNPSEDYAARMYGSVADMFLNGHKHGVAVHCIDPGTGMASLDLAGRQLGRYLSGVLQQENPELYQQFHAFLENPDHQLAPEQAQALENWIDALPPAKFDELKSKYDEIQGPAMDARLNDQMVAEGIAHEARGEKSVIFYGFMHGSGSRDLDEFLGEDRTVRVLLAESRQDYAETAVPIINDPKASSDPVPPAGVYYLKEQEFEELGPQSPTSGMPLIDMAALQGISPEPQPPARTYGSPAHRLGTPRP